MSDNTQPDVSGHVYMIWPCPTLSHSLTHSVVSGYLLSTNDCITFHFAVYVEWEWVGALVVVKGIGGLEVVSKCWQMDRLELPLTSHAQRSSEK